LNADNKLCNNITYNKNEFNDTNNNGNNKLNNRFMSNQNINEYLKNEVVKSDNSLPDNEPNEENLLGNDSSIFDFYKKTVGKIFLDNIRQKNGSKMAQIYLSKCNELSINEFFQKVKKHLTSLMDNKYSNFLMQKLIIKLETSQRMQFLNAIKPQILTLCKHPLGNRTIQELVKSMTTNEEEAYFIELISNNYESLIYNKAGNYVLPVVMKNFKIENLHSLIFYIFVNLLNICTDVNGIVLINSFLLRIKTSDLEYYKKKILNIFSKNLVNLVTDKVSYFCMAYIIDNWDISEYIELVSYIQENIELFACKSFGVKFVRKIIDLKNTSLNKVFCWNCIQNINSYKCFFSFKVSNKLFFSILENLEDETLNNYYNFINESLKEETSFLNLNQRNQKLFKDLDYKNQIIITQMINKILLARDESFNNKRS
jgi:hypothetical protein